MKKYIYLICLSLNLLVTACTSDDDPVKGVGYLRIDAETISVINPRTRIAEDYNPKQLAVQIIDESGEVMYQTDDYETWRGKSFRLEPGIYTVSASSNGFDGMESGFDIPYYAGSTKVTIESGKEATAEITCTLANVKVTVNFSESFQAAFTSANVTVSSAMKGIASQLFTMGQTTKSAYFPVANLKSVVSVVNKAGVPHTSTPYEILQVKARDHHILNYTVAETGSSSVTVEVDGTETVYTFRFPVSTEPTTSLGMKDVNAWSSFAYVTGEVTALQAGKTLDPASMKFEYSTDGKTWRSVAATAISDKDFKATLTGLTKETTYKCRMSYSKGSDNYVSSEMSFITDTATELVNGNLDDWFTVPYEGFTKTTYTWYACSENYYNSNGGSFWDSSNPGTTTGAGYLVNVNPTQGNSSVVHTQGGKSAELKSQYASAAGIGKFAAASLYSGKFKKLVGTNGAILTFGQEFTSRPTQLRGWYKYNAGTIDYKADNVPAEANIVKGSSKDLCSIYIALTTKQYDVDNTDMSTFPDWETDSGVVAYGALPDSECGQVDDWKQFTIDLTYRDLTTKPQYIIIVCSSSKYGDYFTGSTSSLMYLDDMELVYGDSPLVKNN